MTNICVCVFFDMNETSHIIANVVPFEKALQVGYFVLPIWNSKQKMGFFFPLNMVRYQDKRLYASLFI